MSSRATVVVVSIGSVVVVVRARDARAFDLARMELDDLLAGRIDDRPLRCASATPLTVMVLVTLTM